MKKLMLVGLILIGMLVMTSSASAIGVIWGTYDDVYDYSTFIEVEGEFTGFGIHWYERPQAIFPPYRILKFNYGVDDHSATIDKPFYGICSGGIICGMCLGEFII